MNEDRVIIYNNGEIDLQVSLNKETIWLTQKEISLLFEKNRTVITKHINNIFKDREVDINSNVQKMHFANSDKPVSLYSLDIVLAVGYRTNSSKAIKFRKWATKILKKYILNKYVINEEKITNQRFNEVKNSLQRINKRVSLLEFENTLPKQGIYYEGQIFDSFVFITNLIKKAKNEIILIDNYIDQNTLTTLSNKNHEVKVKIYTKEINEQLKLAVSKFNQQYKNLEIKIFNKSHDRFLIIDNQIYHIGASVKDLGKKLFAFSKLNLDFLEVLKTK